jgi:integrase
LRRSLAVLRQQLVRAGRNPVYGPPKTVRGRRTIVLSDIAVDAIRAALVWKKEQRLRLGSKYRDSGLLFVGPTGRPLNPSNLWNRDHTPRLRRLGLPHSRLHDLQHFHGTQLGAAGIDARTIADRLGHSKVSFTLDTCVHPALEAQVRAAAAANDLLTKIGASAR